MRRSIQIAALISAVVINAARAPASVDAPNSYLIDPPALGSIYLLVALAAAGLGIPQFIVWLASSS